MLAARNFLLAIVKTVAQVITGTPYSTYTNPVLQPPQLQMSVSMGTSL